MHALLVAKAAALERTLLLFKVLSNLQYWHKDLGPEAKNQFVKYVVGTLKSHCCNEQEFRAACVRVCVNLDSLMKFLEPVSPDEETQGEEEGDVLLSEVRGLGGHSTATQL